MAKASYAIQAKGDQWVTLFEGEQKGYTLGYFHALWDRHGPQPAYRLIETVSQRVIEESPRRDSAFIGQIAGQPSERQLLIAAIRTLRQLEARIARSDP